MKKIIIYLAIFVFLAGCTGKKNKEVTLEEIPDVNYPPEETPLSTDEISLTIEEIEENVQEETIIQPEINLSQEEKKLEDEMPIIAKKEQKLPKPVIPDEKEKKQDEKFIELLNYFTSWSGEYLLYSAKWNFVNVGKGIIICKEEKNNNGEFYHIVGITVPEGSMAKSGYGYNRVDSFIDKKTLKPYYFYSYVKNGDKERTTEIFFNFNKSEYTWNVKKLKKGTVYSNKTQKVKFNGNLYDGMFVFYVLRSADFESYQKFQYPVAMEKIWNLTITRKDKMGKNVPLLGNKEIYLLEPIAESDEGVFRKGKMNIWLTTDKERVPVYLEGRVTLGTAKLSLISKAKINPNEKLDRALISRILNSVD